MEKMPYRQELDTQVFAAAVEVEQVVTTDWQQRLPVLSGNMVTLRELRASDAPSLFAMLGEAPALETAKVGILLASVVSGIAGAIVLVKRR